MGGNRILSGGKQAALVKPEGDTLVRRVFSRFISQRQTELRQRKTQQAEVDDARNRLLGDAW